MFRVIRVLEYAFEDFEEYEKHMKSLTVPANGVKDFGEGKVTIRSATTLVENIAWWDIECSEHPKK